MNLFFEIAQTAAAALKFDYSGQIFERHHVQKKDAPSGTAITFQKVIRDASGKIESGKSSKAEDVEIVSFREGDAVGMHEVVFNSPNDRIYLCHDAKSRRGFAEGAIRAAEWLQANPASTSSATSGESCKCGAQPLPARRDVLKRSYYSASWPSPASTSKCIAAHLALFLYHATPRMWYCPRDAVYSRRRRG